MQCVKYPHGWNFYTSLKKTQVIIQLTKIQSRFYKICLSFFDAPNRGFNLPENKIKENL